MSGLFDETTINNLTLKNRFVRSATWEGAATADGKCTPKFTEMMIDLARGGVGLIITGHAYIHSSGQGSPFQLSIDRDELIPELTEMTDAVHREDGRIVLQITHAGCQAMVKFTKTEPTGPSVFETGGKVICREMSSGETEEMVRLFGAAAVRAKEAGFDGIQIHCGHGYLLSQFLSPFYNKRTDRYGGSLENRSRIVIETYRSIRNAVGADFPVFIKLNSEDFLENGFTVEEMVDLSGILEKEGIDAIELTGGTIHSEAKLRPVRPGLLDSKDKEVYYRKAAVRYKERIKVPLMLVGGFRSYEVAENAINKGIADYISMSRALVREPALINRWKSGDHDMSRCKSCNLCFRPGIRGTGIYCVAKEKEQEVEKGRKGQQRRHSSSHQSVYKES